MYVHIVNSIELVVGASRSFANTTVMLQSSVVQPIKLENVQSVIVKAL